MKMIILEGTPEEIIKVHQTISGASVANSAGASAPSSKQADKSFSASDGVERHDENMLISTELAKRVLTRRGIAKKQRHLLQQLYKAHPNQLSAADLQKAVNYSKSQFAGLMGAFGRRVSHTEGVPEDTEFFTWEWDEAARAYKYGLPDSVRDAMVQLAMV